MPAFALFFFDVGMTIVYNVDVTPERNNAEFVVRLERFLLWTTNRQLDREGRDELTLVTDERRRANGRNGTRDRDQSDHEGGGRVDWSARR